MDKKFSFIIVAGGKGSRMGGEQKQFMLLDGKPLWRWSADNAADLYDDGIAEIVAVFPYGHYDRTIWPFRNVPLKITSGGDSRSESVLNGLKKAECDYVLVHDAARPFATKKLFLSLMKATTEDTGAVPLLPVADALKKVYNGRISFVNRDELYITQTPQSFHRATLIESLNMYSDVKDEAEAWLKSGHELNYVTGERLNFKVTWPDDMLIARSLVNNSLTRTGIGYDVHRLVPERRLILGGVEILDSPLGLLGHSDADILTHSIMDAVLGASGLPDIGNIFPASDEKYKGADSIKLLEEVIDMSRAEGWRIEFIDSVIEAQVPKLNNHLDAIKKVMSRYFPFNLKFKSPEMIDDSGAGLSMKCWASATLRRLV